MDHIIPQDSIQPCLENYQRILAEHGLDGQTTSVTFNGNDLVKWLKTIPGDFSLKIEFGAYDSNYIATYGLDSSKLNRITVFLVPVDNAAKTTLSAASTTGGTGGGYNFGGIQP